MRKTKKDSTRRKSVAIIHPWLRCAGGSEAEALWIAEALKADFDLTLVTMGDTKLEDLNEYYGTRLGPDEVRIVRIKIPAFFRKGFDALRGYRLARYCRAEMGAFDVTIMTYNVFDFGRRGIQFIGDFSFDDKIRGRLFPKSGRAGRILYREGLIRSAYLGLGRLLSGTDDSRVWENLTVANSEWSRSILKKYFAADSLKLFPPVWIKTVPVAWETKEDGFVAMGRIVPEKRYEDVIQILLELRRRGHPFHLHIVGPLDRSDYSRKLRQLATHHGDWLFLEGSLSGKAKAGMLAGHKYGISACRFEAFGIAVAEMVKSGCLVWVPDSGGQTEIISHPELIYSDFDEAIEKIENVLLKEQRVRELRRHLNSQGALFSPERFQVGIRKIVGLFVAQESLDASREKIEGVFKRPRPPI